MARTTADNVKLILDTDLSDPIIDGFIEAANEVVTEVLGDASITDALKENIERWLTAHLIVSTRERQAIEEEAGPARQKFTDRYGPGLNLTSYGQMAMALDPTNKLAAQLGKKVINLKSIDTPDWSLKSRATN